MSRLPRKALIIAVAGAVMMCWYVVRFEGTPQPLDPLIVAVLQEGPGWLAQPTLLQHIDEPEAIYVVPGFQGSDGLFEALRLDVNSGGRSSARIRFGPDSAYVPFDSAEVVGNPAIEFRGVSLPRPTFHLATFPGGGGPGFHLVDSATGVVNIVAGTPPARRTLLTRTVINSSGMEEMKSLLWCDRARRLAAFVSPERDGWTLYLFSLVSNQTGSTWPSATARS